MTAPDKPRVLVTRKWPDRVEVLIAERCDVTFNEADLPLAPHQLAAAMRDYDAICSTITDRIRAIETRETMGLCGLANLDDWHAGRKPRNSLT